MKNIKIDYIFCFLKNIDFSSAVWVLYLIYKGVPLWQIGILEGIFHTASFISEVPTGALADLLGRKKVMIVGRFCSAVASILMISSNGFVGFAISFIVSAWGYNLNSGSEEALVYDSMKLSGKENEYIKVSGRLNIIIEFAQGISTFAGGVLSEYSYSYCYTLAAIISIISVIPVLLMQEPNILVTNKLAKKGMGILEHFKQSFLVLRENKDIQKILYYYPITFTFYTVMFFYGQKYFSDYGLNKIQISIIMLIAGILSCLGALSSEGILKLLGNKTKYITSICMGISILGMSYHNLMTGIILFAISSYMNALLYPIQSDSLNQLTPSEQRATIISVNSMLFSLMMIIIFPIAGFIAEIIGINKTFLLLGILQLLFIALLLKGKKKRLSLGN